MSDELETWEPTVLNPVDLEGFIQICQRNIARGVRIVTEAETKWRDATREFDRTYARAFLNAVASNEYSRKYHAELDLDVVAARDAMDVAEVAYRHSTRVAKALEAELTGWQSITKSVVAMYGAPQGTGG